MNLPKIFPLFLRIEWQVGKSSKYPITLNVWRYGGEISSKRCFVMSTYRSVEMILYLMMNYLERFNVCKLKKTLNNTLREIIDMARNDSNITCSSCFFCVTIVYNLPEIILANEWVLVALIGILASRNIGIINYLFDPTKIIDRRYSNVTNREALSSTVEQYEDLLLEYC